MHSVELSGEIAHSRARHAKLKADAQWQLVSTMQLSDPALPYAYALLFQMELRAAMAAMRSIARSSTAEALR